MAVLHSQEGQHLKVLSDRICIKLKSTDSTNHMAVMTVEVPPTGFVPPHTHDKEEESYFMLAGTMVMQLGSQELTVETGDFVHVPVGTIHGYRNDTDQPVRFLAWSVGGAIDQFFAEMSEQIREIPNDLPKMPAILAKYGVQMVQPAVAA